MKHAVPRKPAKALKGSAPKKKGKPKPKQKILPSSQETIRYASPVCFASLEHEETA